MDKSIDDQLIREAREDGASRERIRIRHIVEAEYAYWVDSPGRDFSDGATAACSNVLCRIDGLLPARNEREV